MVRSLLAASLLAHSSAVLGLSNIKNVIYIVPDGYGQASQTMARDFVSLQQPGSNASSPLINELAADRLVVGTVRTHASDDLITDSAASGTAFACGVKSYNSAIGVNPAGEPVGSILETAKLAGYKTGLVVTSTINHATPAAYAAHVANRNSYAAIAAQEIGYSHPFGPTVDILLGGGRCYFKPQSDPTSCRDDDLDLFKFAAQKGYHVMQDRAAFDRFTKSSNASLPYIGLFNDDQMMYEVDRAQNPEKEPSLLEMAKFALDSLDKATSTSPKGYFIMIEASRIDHAGHANDATAHIHDTIMYNAVLDHATTWIDTHPDTLLMSAADHECGGLTLNGYDPSPLTAAQHSFEYAQDLINRYTGPDRPAFLASTILPAVGLGDIAPAQRDALLRSANFVADAKRLVAQRGGVNWSTGGHTASDVTLHGYAAGAKGREFKADMAGHWDNTELPRYLAKVLGLDLDATTRKLRVAGVPAEGAEKRRRRRSGGHNH